MSAGPAFGPQSKGLPVDGGQVIGPALPPGQPPSPAGSNDGNHKGTLPVLYLMCPIPLYDSPVLAAAREYPFTSLTGCAVELVCAADLYCCNKHWIASWPELRARIRFGVFLDHLDGFVGRGTFAEVMELLALSVPVWWHRDGEPTDSFRFGPADYRDWGGRYRPVMAVPQEAVGAIAERGRD